MRRRAYAYNFSPGLSKWSHALQGLGPTGIPVAASDGFRNWVSGGVKATHYRIEIGQFTQQLHPSLDDTTLWGYGQSGSFRHLGGVIVANRNAPVQITFVNKLPATHILPVDVSSFFPDASETQNKTAVHLHGGLVPWICDGGPFDWFTNGDADKGGGAVGPSFKNNQVLNPGAAAGEAEYYYPNNQSARLMWYHDHAHDITRLNAYAGIASGYIIRDTIESALIQLGVIPTKEVPLIFQDKIFQEDGSLWYPSVYEGDTSGTGANIPATPGDVGKTLRWDQGAGTPPLISCIPEMFGDTILTNGTVYPYLEVEPRRYRFRILNACNARFLNLQLYLSDGSAEGITLQQEIVGGVGQTDSNTNPVMIPTNAAGPAMIQIGNEAGFLFAPATYNVPPKPIHFDLTPLVADPSYGSVDRYNLLLAPAERADVIIDFAGLSVGQELFLYSDAPAPFPGGDVRNDTFFGDQDMSLIGGPPATAAGFGPNTRTLLKFRIKAASTPADRLTTVQMMNLLTTYLGRQATTLSQVGASVRNLTLNEDFDPWGRLIQMVGTDVLNGPGYGRLYADTPTEVISNHATEIWQIWNMTGDTHPMHFHLINAQILYRQKFDGVAPGAAHLVGGQIPPDANEIGWKETIRINPGQMVAFIAKFDLPPVPFTVPLSDRILGYHGHEYVYHCHILEHEEHDMMRPLIIT
jgi:spore coat protein A